jgi:hypothetical protein
MRALGGISAIGLDSPEPLPQPSPCEPAHKLKRRVDDQRTRIDRAILSAPHPEVHGNDQDQVREQTPGSEKRSLPRRDLSHEHGTLSRETEEKRPKAEDDEQGDKADDDHNPSL